MQPQQPYYQPPSSPVPDNNGQYDFIVNNSAPSGRPNPKTMLLFIAGAAAILIVLLWIILSLAVGGKGGATAPLVAIAQQQTEIVRVAKLADDSNRLTSQDARNFSSTTHATLSTDQSALVAFLAKHGKKLNAKQLGLKQNSTTDTALNAAAASGTYDSTVTSTLQTQLKACQTSLTQAFNGATSATEKALLKNDYDHIQLLLAQSVQHN